MPPPAKVLADADVRLIVPVPVTVRFVEVAAAHAVELAAGIVQVPEPTATVLARVLADKSTVALAPEKVTLYVAASNVPAFIRNAADTLTLVVNASCNVTEPEGDSIVNACVNVPPALVIV